METKEIAGQVGKRDIQGKDAPRRKSKNTSRYQEMTIRRPVYMVFKGEKRQLCPWYADGGMSRCNRWGRGGYKGKQVK